MAGEAWSLTHAWALPSTALLTRELESMPSLRHVPSVPAYGSALLHLRSGPKRACFSLRASPGLLG